MAALGISALLATTAACSASGEVLDAGGVKVVVAAPADSGMDAMVIGTVTVVDGCLGVNDDVAVWPSGTTVVGSGPAVIKVPGLGELAVGDAVTGAGGYLQPEDYERNIDGPEIPDSCSAAGIVVYRPG